MEKEKIPYENEFNPYQILFSATGPGMVAVIDRINGLHQVVDSAQSELLQSLLRQNDKEISSFMVQNWEEVLTFTPKKRPKMGILQLRKDDEQHYRRFLDIKGLKKILHEDPDIRNYELVYTESISTKQFEDPIRTCNAAYAEFNRDTYRPANYYGHSLSVSDVIVLFDGDKDFECYYVDSIGFAKLTDFLSERMKNQVIEDFTVRDECDLLQSLKEEMNLPETYERRAESLMNNYRKVFEMADVRKGIFEKQETDPLFGILTSFDMQNIAPQTVYFAIGKDNRWDDSYRIYASSKLLPSLQKWSMCFPDVDSAKQMIASLSATNASFYKMHPPVLVTKEDLARISEEFRRREHGLDAQIADAKRDLEDKRKEIRKEHPVLEECR